MGEKVDNAPENVDKSNQSFSLTLGIKVYILSFKKMKLAPLGDTPPHTCQTSVRVNHLYSINASIFNF